MFRLILVEDEPRILRYLKDKISSLSSDFKVVGMYNNGEDALVELHWTQPHVLITDIRMPLMDGIELIERVKEQMPDTQCAIVSGHDDFAYLKKAIKLGITDYLLKPAADEEMLELLAKLKEKLMLNQSLLQNEIARQLVEAPEEPFQAVPAWKDIVRELFYHGNYILTYAWSASASFPLNYEIVLTELLGRGETSIRLPSHINQEEIILLGLHSWNPVRQRQWREALSHALHQTDVTATIALSAQGLTSIPELLAKCRRQAPLQNRFDGHCFALGEETNEHLAPVMELLQPSWTRLTQYVMKQQKHLFCKELDNVFAGVVSPSLPITRSGWEKLLMQGSHTLHSLIKDLSKFQFEYKQAMEQELREEVWRQRHITDLQHSIKEIWSGYFFRNEQEQNTQRDWAKEARQYINDHFHDNITLSSIADIFELHPAYLNRIFKRAHQTSIPDYLVNLRMNEACRFIREHPFVLIKEIAEHVGYLDPFYFSKVFKLHTGLSPSDYKSSLS